MCCRKGVKSPEPVVLCRCCYCVAVVQSQAYSWLGCCWRIDIRGAWKKSLCSCAAKHRGHLWCSLCGVLLLPESAVVLAAAAGSAETVGEDPKGTFGVKLCWHPSQSAFQGVYVIPPVVVWMHMLQSRKGGSVARVGIAKVCGRALRTTPGCLSACRPGPCMLRPCLWSCESNECMHI